jgi:hypothetical protein
MLQNHFDSYKLISQPNNLRLAEDENGVQLLVNRRH